MATSTGTKSDSATISAQGLALLNAATDPATGSLSPTRSSSG
jgi:hypothetical protein